jgi:hypothetical protein
LSAKETGTVAKRQRGGEISTDVRQQLPRQFGVEKPQRVDGLFRFDFGERHPEI